MRKELQVWVSRQRAQRKLVDQPGTKSGMTKDKIEALGEIDFPWAPCNAVFGFGGQPVAPPAYPLGWSVS